MRPDRQAIQDLYIRVCKDARWQMDYLKAAFLTAGACKVHVLDVWMAMPDLKTMERIAKGDHPVCHKELVS